MMSGPPANEPKGGVPVATWAETTPAERATVRSAKAKRCVYVMAWLREGLKSCPCTENCRGQPGVEDDGLKLNVEEQAVVQKLLDVEGDVSTVDGAVVGEANFAGNVEERIVVGVGPEVEGGGEIRGGIEENIHLAEPLQEIGSVARNIGGLLIGAEMSDGDAVFRFGAEVGDDGVWRVEEACKGEGRE